MTSSNWASLAVVISLAIPAAAATSGCKGDGEKGGEKTAAPNNAPGEAVPAEVKELTVYSGRGEKLVGPALKAFEAKSGIKLKVKYAGTSELAATLLDEGKSSPADVFIAQDASSLGFLASKEMFAKLPSELTAKIASAPAAGTWVPLTGRARVLAYNTKKLKPEDLPKSAAELTDKKWKGRVGWAPANASFQGAVAAMVQLAGPDVAKKWLIDMKANGAKEYPKNTPAVMAVSRGEVDVALVNHYYLYRLRAEHGTDFPVENHYFKDGSAHSMVNLSGAAVLASSKKAGGAQRLLSFLVSPEGQKLFVEGNHEFPVAAAAISPAGLPPIAELGAPKVDLTALKDLKATHQLLRETKVLP